MKHKTLTRLAALLCGVALLSPGPTAAHAPQAPKPQGTYNLDEAASDDVNTAIKEAVKHVIFYARGAVKDELTKNTRPYKRIEIHYTRTDISVATDQWGAIKTAADGTAVKWTRPDGEKFEVSTVWEGSELKQTFTGEKGRRVNIYSLGADGKTLTMRASVANATWLKQPMTFKLSYKSGTRAADVPSASKAKPQTVIECEPPGRPGE